MRPILLLPLLLIGCGFQKPNLVTPPSYVGMWRTGTSKDDYRLFRIFQDKSISILGTKQDLMAPADLVGDELTIKADKATTKSPSYSATAAQFPIHIKRISESKIEMTDPSGTFFGVTTPVPFEQITTDEFDQTSAQIMQRAMNGG